MRAVHHKIICEVADAKLIPRLDEGKIPRDAHDAFCDGFRRAFWLGVKWREGIEKSRLRAAARKPKNAVYR